MEKQRLLDKMNSPTDLRKLTRNELAKLASEIRSRMIQTISANGGHLASSLGVVELTIALHRVFDSPRDKIIWDVGHQCYAHKMLTGRMDKFDTIRQYGGLSGFPVISESPHDAFGTGHAGNSISAALGIALARDLNKDTFNVIAVIGDGSLGTGIALEATNHAGHERTKLIVILNDNGMSISPSVGALSRLFNQVRINSRYGHAKTTAKNISNRLPFGNLIWTLSKKMKNSVESIFVPSAFWEQLGFNYIGPIDGHNITDLEKALKRVRDSESGPTVIHILTQKGKGYPEAETDVVKYHGINPNGTAKSIVPSYSQVFGDTVLKIMHDNEKVIAITAAMLDGTGLKDVSKLFPRRVIDVGICEQHAVTLAAGLATQGFIPIVAIYSTFLQRAYDQIIHDVCLQHLPVVFAIDRAGIVGDDGKTHQGSFDIAFLRCIPDMVLAAPSDENELQNLLYTAIRCGHPMAIRYPRGQGENIPLSGSFHEIPEGKGELLREGKDLTILGIGPVVHRALKAAARLSKEGIDCAVINARYAKPLDEELIISQCRKTRNLLTLEESSLKGGFGSAVAELLSTDSAPSPVKLLCLGLPDKFIEHGSQQILRSLSNIDEDGIYSFIKSNFVGMPVRQRVNRI